MEPKETTFFQEAVIDRLRFICEKLENMHSDRIALYSKRAEQNEVWLDNCDVQKELKIRPSTVYRLKCLGLITPSKLGGKNYYRQSEIRALLNKKLSGAPL